MEFPDGLPQLSNYGGLPSGAGGTPVTLENRRKLARIFYKLLKNGAEYVDQGQNYYEEQYRERVMSNLKKRAASLGFDLTPMDEISDITIA